MTNYQQLLYNHQMVYAKPSEAEFGSQHSSMNNEIREKLGTPAYLSLGGIRSGRDKIKPESSNYTVSQRKKYLQIKL